MLAFRAFIFVYINSFAKTFAYAALTSHTKLRNICQQSPVKCLDAIEIESRHVSNQSFQWFELKLLKIEALFLLERFDELTPLLHELKAIDGVPTYFSTKVYYYLAKISPPSPEKKNIWKKLRCF